MVAIPPEEIQYSNLSCVDDVGRVFHWREGIYRGINAGAAEHVWALFASGFLDELAERGLFPHSRITEHTLNGFALVVQHELVPCITYPHEWSFNMFRDAALTVLEISRTGARFGWTLKDCHPYNLLFNGARPMYVDLGSFMPITPGNGLVKCPGFLASYWYPLYIWAAGDSFLAQRIVSSGHEEMPALSWQLYRNPIRRWLSPQLGARITRRRERVLKRGAQLLGDGHKLERAVASLVSYLPAELFVGDADMLQRKIEDLAPPPPTSTWHDYQGEYFQTGVLASTPRFDRILEIVQSLNCESVVELAGNQGLLSLLLLRHTSVTRVICTDYDSHAINRLHGYCSNLAVVPAGKMLQSAVINFMIPELNFYTLPPAERFRGDLVTALAITHHLTLSQNFQLRQVIQTIADYTRRFALVEFMPLGLWNGHEAPRVPEWYTLEWFQHVFAEFFDLLQVEEVETNRVLHLGRLKGS